MGGTRERAPALSGAIGYSGPAMIGLLSARLAGIGRRIFLAAGYLDGNFTPGFGASTCGLRKVELTGATFLSAFGFLASRLPRCLLPLPMIVHPTVVLPPGTR
jgi:hypothetical protein